MKHITTHTGDNATTALRGGFRVAKDHPAVEANGALDELNVRMGMLRACLASSSPDNARLILHLQRCLMSVMSVVATPATAEPANAPAACESLIAEMEADITAYTAGQPTRRFIIPGSSVIESRWHLARTAARTAERRLVTLHRSAPLPDGILAFINRLSDWLFVMACQSVDQPDDTTLCDH